MVKGEPSVVPRKFEDAIPVLPFKPHALAEPIFSKLRFVPRLTSANPSDAVAPLVAMLGFPFVQNCALLSVKPAAKAAELKLASRKLNVSPPGALLMTPPIPGKI